MMELDELKQKWAEHDRKLEVNIRLTRQLLSATKMNRARSALQRLAVFLALESVIALAVIIVLGSFIGDHIAMVRFAVPAAPLDLFELQPCWTDTADSACTFPRLWQTVAAIQKLLDFFGRYISVTSSGASASDSPLTAPIVALRDFCG